MIAWVVDLIVFGEAFGLDFFRENIRLSRAFFIGIFGLSIFTSKIAVNHGELDVALCAWDVDNICDEIHH